MPILPPFIQRSEKYKKFYKKYIENVMKGMVAGKWSDNAISSLEYKLEKQKRTNQSEQRTFWVPNRTSDFRLTGEYPDWSRPSLSVKMPDVLQQNTVYSFMDIVKKNLKNGETESSSTLLVDTPVITGRPVYLPEGPVSVPLATTTLPTPPSTTSASSGNPVVTITVTYERVYFFLSFYKVYSQDEPVHSVYYDKIRPLTGLQYVAGDFLPCFPQRKTGELIEPLILN